MKRKNFIKRFLALFVAPAILYKTGDELAKEFRAAIPDRYMVEKPDFNEEGFKQEYFNPPPVPPPINTTCQAGPPLPISYAEMLKEQKDIFNMMNEAMLNNRNGFTRVEWNRK